MEDERTAKKVYVRESAIICSVVRPWKRWTDTEKDCLKKKGLDVRQARRWCMIAVNGRGF